MKKILIYFTLFIITMIVSLSVILSTAGIKTNKFNNFISEKVSQSKNIELKLNTVKFKINPKEISLFLETEKPEITYKNVKIPAQNIRVYVDFLSLIKSNPKIKKTSLILKELDISEINELSLLIKPSNLKSLLNHKIKKGRLISEIDIFLNDKGLLENFIAKGLVKNLKVELMNDVNFKNINLGFFADKKDILIKNLAGDLEDIKITDGDIRLNLDDGIKLNSNFNSKFNFDEKHIQKYSEVFNKFKFLKNIKIFKANLSNNISINLDKTYKVKGYNYGLTGKISKGKFEMQKSISSNLISGDIKKIYLSDLQVTSVFKPKNVNLKSEGKYSFNNLDFLKLNLEQKLINNNLILNLDFDYKNSLELDFINYKKNKDSLAIVSIDLNKEKDNFEIKNLNFKEGKNLIKINNLLFKKNKLITFKKVEIKTKNNDFSILNDKKIFIKGTKFDAKNLIKSLNQQDGENRFQNINKMIEIDFKNIAVPMTEKLENFKLIGEIKKGQFTKISSKGDFGGNNFLDISMKKDKNTNRKYLEIYSDLPRPLLTEYSFFKGLSGGKLLFTSIIDDASSISKLNIENFKVINAPGVIKLLSLADLGGLVDLAEGEGLTFDVLEINMEKNKNFLKINEILALGPSVSVLMEGYQDEKGVTSLRGTLVPAKTLNKIISKIPIIGNIVIPKEIGEGLFGISFKMKGEKGKIKTTINPIRTLTPRFIQKIVDKNKKKTK